MWWAPLGPIYCSSADFTSRLINRRSEPTRQLDWRMEKNCAWTSSYAEVSAQSWGPRRYGSATKVATGHHSSLLYEVTGTRISIKGLMPSQEEGSWLLRVLSQTNTLSASRACFSTRRLAVSVSTPREEKIMFVPIAGLICSESKVGQ